MKFALPEMARGNMKSILYLNKLFIARNMDAKGISLLTTRKKERLLKHAKENVPFYNRFFSEKGKPKDFASIENLWCSLPLIDRDLISPQEDAFISANLSGCEWKDTSGSTGRKFRFLTDRYQALWAEASTAFVRKQITGKLVPAETVLWGAPRDRTPEDKLRTKAKGALRKYHQIIAHNPNRQFLLNTLDKLAADKPELLLGYPNLLLLLIDCDQENTLRSIPWIITAGEWLRDDIRLKLEDHFGSRLFDFYGCREMGSIAYECPEHNGLHILSPMVFLETINPDGSKCRDGEVGEIVLTSLVRRSMPFIRYRIGDMGSVVSDPCPCGCPFPRLKALAGRTMDIVHLPGGYPVTANFWTFLSREIGGIKQFRVVQNEQGHIRMEIILEEGESITENDVKKIIAGEISNRLGFKIGIDVAFIDELPVNQSGKTGLVVSHYRKEK